MKTAPRKQRCKPKPAVKADRSDAFAAAIEAAALEEEDPEFRAALLALVAADRKERAELDF